MCNVFFLKKNKTPDRSLGVILCSAIFQNFSESISIVWNFRAILFRASYQPSWPFRLIERNWQDWRPRYDVTFQELRAYRERLPLENQQRLFPSSRNVTVWWSNDFCVRFMFFLTFIFLWLSATICFVREVENISSVDTYNYNFIAKRVKMFIIIFR